MRLVELGVLVTAEKLLLEGTLGILPLNASLFSQASGGIAAPGDLGGGQAMAGS